MMDKLTYSYSKEIPVKYDVDVLVVGGGPAGCGAAIAAAREGAKTLLLEATGALGGMGTSGLLPTWATFSDGKRNIYCGLAEKLFTALKQAMPDIIPKDKTMWVPIDSEKLKRIYDDMVSESGASVIFNTFLADVDANDANVTAVIVANKSGLSAYRGKVYVDCTGDADLAARAGAEYEKGDPTTGELQPATHCFVIANVNQEALDMGPALKSKDPACPIHRIVESGKYPLIRDKHFEAKVIGPGTVALNAGHIWNVDNTDAVSVSQAMAQGRRIAAAFRDALAEFFPEAFGDSILVETAPLMGIRETRRIIGDYVLTVDDYLARRKFSDEIGRNSYFIDIHHSEQERTLEAEGKFDWKARCASYEAGESHGIPYRCLTPKGLKNVLVAGRSISCDRPVQGSIRVMSPCMVMGEAAGTAAALAAQCKDPDVHDVDIHRLRYLLKGYGAYLPEVEKE